MHASNELLLDTAHTVEPHAVHYYDGHYLRLLPQVTLV